MMPHHKVITGLQNHIAEQILHTRQKVITITYVRFKVTTCLYLNPNNRARSLSTLIAVIVIADTPQKVLAVVKPATDA